MNDDIRLKLLHGPYYPPRVKTGDSLQCEVHGLSRVGGYTDAPIPWPRRRKTGKASLIVCGDLARAIRSESEIAIAHHWGVGVVTVWGWRKALGVGRITEGTGALYREYWPEKLPEEVSAIGRDRAMEPEVVERVRLQRVGKPAHPRTAAALREAAKRPKSEEWKLQLAERNRERGYRPPVDEWTPAEDALLGTATDRAVAEKTGRTLPGVRQRRQRLGIPAWTASAASAAKKGM